ncbi:MAG: hypothetical protein NPIRA02_27680 [Nitrospirales bacterium]|nr:MAG: hypothetical protein NPIRA02_27680 [Nitrospirales bacterium]
MTNRNTSSTRMCLDLDIQLRKRETKTLFGRYTLCMLFVILIVGSYAEQANAQDTPQPSMAKRSIIPILGTTYNEQWEQVGIVADVEVEFQRRNDHNGLQIRFLTKPGRFSSLAKRSVQEALALVTQAAGLNADSWTVQFRLPYAGVTLYGESLSAMAAMSVVALAKGEMVHSDIVMTGTVTPEGSIGTVGGIPLKIVAAHEEHFRRVLIPEEPDVADGDWQTPFLMHISPVKSVDVAYFALTDHPLKTPGADQQFAVSLAR